MSPARIYRKKRSGNRPRSSSEEIGELRRKLQEAEETLDAIRRGEVDGLVVFGPSGDQVYTLSGADYAYRRLIETMKEGAVSLLLDAGHTIAYCNLQFATLVARPLEQVIGSSFLTYVRPDQIERLEALLKREEDDHVRSEFVLTAGDKTFTDALITISAPTPESHTRTLIVTDISQQKNAEEELRRARDELQERSAQLSASNKELEAFSYSVAHDLRAPLRAVSGYAGMLLDQAFSKLDERERHFLRSISKSAGDMGSLIDALLSFSRLNRNELTMRNFDMGRLVSHVVEECRNAESPRRNVDVRISELPCAHGDQMLIRQVLSNLISNAFKFTRKNAGAVIEVLGELTDSECLYRVRDNGVGFDMQHSGKLFGVFQRLHHAEEFEGTGAGLAFAQRIILRHGGRIWGEGEEGKGATFSFTLPRPPRTAGEPP